MRCNDSFTFGDMLGELEQEEIRNTPSGVHDLCDFDKLVERGIYSSAVRNIARRLPWKNDREFQTLIVRSQGAAALEKRTGSFWHLDIDVVGKQGQIVAPTWDDMRLAVVSFGDACETEFIAEPLELAVGPVPAVSLYVELAGRINAMQTQAGLLIRRARPGQVVSYSSRDIHRAGPIRNHRNRLLLIAVESDHVHA